MKVANISVQDRDGGSVGRFATAVATAGVAGFAVVV
jgi:hypothetical protein